MATHLQVVTPSAHAPAFEPKVFSREFVSKLSAVNESARELREMGYQVLSVSLESECLVYTPQIQVKGMKHPGMRRLKEYANRYECALGIGYAFFDDVLVWWEEA